MTATTIDLISKLTVDEKVSLVAAVDWWRTPTINREDVFIPHIKMSDGPNGARGESYVSGITAACFPCSTAVGATFDSEQAYMLGKEIAKETKTKSANVLLAPTINIIRSPLGGRNYETYSEDPYLIGTLASAFVRGCQSEGIAATPKHFVANESEKSRTRMTSNIDRQTLREIYMLPFQLVMRDSDPWCFMTSYNRLNGEYCADSQWLLEEVLRKEWGFSGLVVSDWMGTYSTAQALNSGLDLEMPGPTRWRGQKLLEEIEAGTVTTETLDKSVGRVIELARKTGRFGDPIEKPERSVEDPERLEFITSIAADGMVLLKNDNNILPLSPKVSVAVIGHHALHPSIGGGGSAKVLAQHIISPLDGLKAQSVNCRHAPGVPVFGALPHAEPETLSPVQLRWFNSSVVGERLAHEQAITLPEYMIKEAWPAYLNKEYCTSMSFTLRPMTSGSHVFSVITTGKADVLVNGDKVFYRPQETVLLPESFYFYKAKIERRFTLDMIAGQEYKIELHSWATDPELLSKIGGTIFQGASLRFMEHVDIPRAIQDAAVVAASSDVAVVFVGTTNELESEGYDRDTMDLTSDQYDLINAVVALNPRTVVVNLSGSPVTVSPFIDQVPCFLQAWFAGQECGHAISRVLLGHVNPSGRLPMSWPRRNEDNPAYPNFPCDDNLELNYEERLKVGYRFYDEECAPKPQFHFGEGLSYTTFELTGRASVTSTFDCTNTAETLLLSEVKNTGTKDGKQVVQVYVTPPSCDGNPRPVKDLRSYCKVFVQAGQTEKVKSKLDKYAFSYFDTAVDKWKMPQGEFLLHICFSSAEILQTVTVTNPKTQYWTGL
ncbi:glycoside hydrolase superfamily [Fusarium redolens]|uniref:beta-glucosidase n=1 Tax=Fusarium redolens TaxID=48865 RepID=A0A9P9GLU9_FUSRE|nr:glycoside hydrolase superfamily [Fusarium redolens]KAH7240247.1 glycoside hydrolase superfamily [Fusarium redolens]